MRHIALRGPSLQLSGDCLGTGPEVSRVNGDRVPRQQPMPRPNGDGPPVTSDLAGAPHGVPRHDPRSAVSRSAQRSCISFEGVPGIPPQCYPPSRAAITSSQSAIGVRTPQVIPSPAPRSVVRVSVLHDCVALAAACLSVLLPIGCGRGGGPDRSSFQVSGIVARSCVGPLIEGRGARCSDRALFEGAGIRRTVHGAFRITLPEGVYTLSVDSCRRQQTVHVNGPISSLRLVPRCVLPL